MCTSVNVDVYENAYDFMRDKIGTQEIQNRTKMLRSATIKCSDYKAATDL